MHGAGRGRGQGGEVGQLVDLQQGALAVAERKRGAFFDEVVREAVYAALGELSRRSVAALESRRACGVGKTKMRWAAGGGRRAHLFAARLARVLVAVAGILELGAALEELEDQLVWAPSHGSAVALGRGVGVAEILPKRCEVGNFANALASAESCRPRDTSAMPLHRHRLQEPWLGARLRGPSCSRCSRLKACVCFLPISRPGRNSYYSPRSPRPW